jgi:hypothetical protein
MSGKSFRMVCSSTMWKQPDCQAPLPGWRPPEEDHTGGAATHHGITMLNSKSPSSSDWNVVGQQQRTQAEPAPLFADRACISTADPQ